MRIRKIISIVLIPILIGSFLIFNYYKSVYQTNAGYIQGTTYTVKYENKIDLGNEIDSLLHQFDLSLSTYLPISIISKVNKNDTTVVLDAEFIKFFKVSKLISELTEGAFDITVAPIVNAWGFGFTEAENVDSAMIDSLLNYVGYENVTLANNKIIKKNSGIMLDGNAIAQGQSVDYIAAYLEKMGIENYMVDIGGEIRTKGINSNKQDWRIGIDKPLEKTTEEDRQLQAVLNISNKSIATSGNYRKFYVKDGVKYAHTINPRTGYPVKHNLLSATVIADECIYADALATAFMVMGLEKAKLFLAQYNQYQAYLISDEEGKYKVFQTEGLNEIIEEY